MPLTRRQLAGRPGFSAPEMRTKIDAIRQGERRAEWERGRLDLGTEPLRNPLDLLERHGVRVGPLAGAEAADLDGVYFETDELGACVGVNPARNRESCFRMMFTTAHEYAHWLLKDRRVEAFRFQPAGDDLKETRANAFAAAFLAPEDGLRDYFGSDVSARSGRIEAFRLAYPNVELASLAGRSPAEVDGFLNAWKGKYFEVIVRDRLNAGEWVGVVHLMEDRDSDAITAFERALRLEPDYPDAHYNLGALYADVGSLRAAAHQHRALRRLDPDYAELLAVHVRG